jgi:hypothetical protein
MNAENFPKREPAKVEAAPLQTIAETPVTSYGKDAPNTPTNQPPAFSKIARISSIRSKIHKRKSRSFQAKTDIKRKSVKQVHAFIVGINGIVLRSGYVGDGGDVTMSGDKAMKTNVIKELLSNTMVQNQYRVTTQLKSSVQASSQMPENEKSFIEFLERNTPSKMTRTEIEEIQKAKEKKTQERLKERDKARQEKTENARK